MGLAAVEQAVELSKLKAFTEAEIEAWQTHKKPAFNLIKLQYYKIILGFLAREEKYNNLFLKRIFAEDREKPVNKRLVERLFFREIWEGPVFWGGRCMLQHASVFYSTDSRKRIIRPFEKGL
jgi:hypothetical protein